MSKSGFELTLASKSNLSSGNDSVVVWVSTSLQAAQFKAKLVALDLFNENGGAPIESVSPLDLKFAQDDIDLVLTEDEHFDVLGKIITTKLDQAKRCA